jgi:S-adenosylmethionine decarboxylase
MAKGWEDNPRSLVDHSTTGNHVLIDVWGAEFSILDDVNKLSKLVQKIVVDANMTLVNLSLKKFQPQGVTVLGLLEESHISVHTYPEHGYAAFDIFTCSDTDPFEAIMSNIEKTLKPKSVSFMRLGRGDEKSKKITLKLPRL